MYVIDNYQLQYFFKKTNKIVLQNAITKHSHIAGILNGHTVKKTIPAYEKIIQRC